MTSMTTSSSPLRRSIILPKAARTSRRPPFQPESSRRSCSRHSLVRTRTRTRNLHRLRRITRLTTVDHIVALSRTRLGLPHHLLLGATPVRRPVVVMVESLPAEATGTGLQAHPALLALHLVMATAPFPRLTRAFPIVISG